MLGKLGRPYAIDLVGAEFELIPRAKNQSLSIGHWGAAIFGVLSLHHAGARGF